MNWEKAFDWLVEGAAFALVGAVVIAVGIVGSVAFGPEPRTTCLVHIQQKHMTSVVEGHLRYEGQDLICEIGGS